jgi:hypothetical protein
MLKVICPTCKKEGDCITKRTAKIKVQVPRNPRINTASDAWDYAARVYFRLRDNVMLFPPTSPDNDELWAQNTYRFFSKFTSHTNEEIKAFDSKHLSTPNTTIDAIMTRLTSQVKRTTEAAGDYYKSVDNKLPRRETLHIKLPKDTGRITKYSTSLLYGAIVCKSLGDISTAISSAVPEYDRNVANAIYSLFKSMSIDFRHSTTLKDWILILPDVIDHGYNAASSKNYMSSTKGEKRHLSSKHIRKKSEKFFQVFEDMKNSHVLEYYKSFEEGFEFITKNNPDLKDDFLRRFHEHELEALRGDFLAKYYYFVGHWEYPENDDKKSKIRKWCPIKESEYVKLHNENYVKYDVDSRPFLF